MDDTPGWRASGPLLMAAQLHDVAVRINHIEMRYGVPREGSIGHHAT